MEPFLRDWAKSAGERNEHVTQIYVLDKLYAITNKHDHLLDLANAHFQAQQYTRALSLVTRSELHHRLPAAKHLAAYCYIKQNRHDDALGVLGEKNPSHLFTSLDASRRKLQALNSNSSLTSKGHGKAKASTRLERADRSEERDFQDKSSIKYEAAMCYLRGLCYAKQNAFERAKDCYKDAVRIDVQCFEAFDQLMKNSLMSPGEEWAFLESLNFESIQLETGEGDGAQEAAGFVRNLYITRLSKYGRLDDFSTALDTLSTHYHLAENPDILLARADMLFASSRFEPALHLTSAILSHDPYNFACLPTHLSLLYQLHHTTTLFALSHDLADTHPSEPCTWLAVGTYYLATSRIPEARSYFSKASLMDPHFGPAWIGFAHTFAAEGEGDQAIAAYSTAARLFQGTHLPQLFLGMQEMALENLAIAREYLTAAYELCKTDPLLINEIGVCSYKEGDLDSAIRSFDLALRLAEDCEAPPQQYRDVRLNLAHALRRAGRLQESLVQFDEVIRLGLRDCGVFASKGLVLLELERVFEATVALHEGLALSPQDPLASELLGKALGLLEGEGVLGGQDEEAVDAGLLGKVEGIRRVRAAGGERGGRRKRGARVEGGRDEGMEVDGG
ncbi:anaphase-promoting complex subunit Cut9 [Recurvomyces mirabilis]|uniref:Anaphase-promoting complex subunit Cut9 n=1 Tax=Recurvomyces mirabilis TaxID=574656 RepID=A0AAE0WXH2_9PEZI|nr:anaphase-promoting complex subunit Cut9 [Recurvomyces mirabilis]KAK5161959.1 anaphase-promoting complex subunit Cut9 [Recurvomyces mirabilis]